MATPERCLACGCESDGTAALVCPQCGQKFLRPRSFSPWLTGLAVAVLMTGPMFLLHFPKPLIVFTGLASFLFASLGLSSRRTYSAKPSPPPLSSRPKSVLLLNLLIALLGLAFVTSLLLGSVSFINAHNAFERVHGQPYHATVFQVIRPYFQKSAGMHGPDISVYASGNVEGKKEWMNLIPYLKGVPRDQVDLNNSVPPGTTIPVYLFPNLKGQSRIQVIDVLPPGEASRRTEALLLKRIPVVLMVTGLLILLLMRIRRIVDSHPT